MGRVGLDLQLLLLRAGMGVGGAVEGGLVSSCDVAGAWRKGVGRECKHGLINRLQQDRRHNHRPQVAALPSHVNESLHSTVTHHMCHSLQAGDFEHSFSLCACETLTRRLRH